jgi:hypothetical protein
MTSAFSFGDDILRRSLGHPPLAILRFAMPADWFEQRCLHPAAHEARTLRLFFLTDVEPCAPADGE